MEQLMSDHTNHAVTKYADSIITWGGVFRTIFTVLGWIYLIGGPFIGFVFVAGAQAPATYLLMGILAGVVGAVGMFGYRIIFDYLLMKAHQAKG
jgi:hypothetical protein